MKLKIALLGATGMLGSEFDALLKKNGHQVIAYHSTNLDFQYPETLKTALDLSEIDFVINCAAYTKVDDCETNQNLANTINGKAVEALAHHCKAHNIPLIHFSTDYVFDGQKNSPYTEEDPVNPINAYGTSKLLGEKAIQSICTTYYIFRVQWLC